MICISGKEKGGNGDCTMESVESRLKSPEHQVEIESSKMTVSPENSSEHDVSGQMRERLDSTVSEQGEINDNVTSTNEINGSRESADSSVDGVKSCLSSDTAGLGSGSDTSDTVSSSTSSREHSQVTSTGSRRSSAEVVPLINCGPQSGVTVVVENSQRDMQVS